MTIGSKNYTEQLVLGQLYTQALQAKGYTVHLKAGIGPTEVINKQLADGRIDMYPEYTGVLNSVVATLHTLTAPGAPVKTYIPPTTRQEAYRQAAEFEKSRGFTMLRPAPYDNGIRVALKPAFAKKHHLSSMTDLGKLSGFSFGGPGFIKGRFEGLRGMRQVYGLADVKFVAYPPGKQYPALAKGKVDTIAVLLTDGQLTNRHLVLLSDPRNVFGFQNVAPVVNNDILSKLGPAFPATLNQVSASLTNPVMRRLNAKVDLGGQEPAKVARAFLAAHDLS